MRLTTEPEVVTVDGRAIKMAALSHEETLEVGRAVAADPRRLALGHAIVSAMPKVPHVGHPDHAELNIRWHEAHCELSPSRAAAVAYLGEMRLKEDAFAVAAMVREVDGERGPDGLAERAAWLAEIADLDKLKAAVRAWLGDAAEGKE